MNQIDVLIIQDKESEITFLKQLLENLEDWKITVLSAKSFEAAKLILASDAIDVILLDYYIKGKKPDVFLSEIQNLTAQIPVVLISSLCSVEIKPVALELKVDDFICKKDLTSVLLSRIIKYCLSFSRERLISRIQKEKYYNLFHNSLEAIFTADKNHRILKANKSFRDMIQYDITENFDFRVLFVDGGYKRYLSALSSNRNIKRTQLKRADGKILEVYLAISRIFNNVDSESFQVVIHDVTELEELQHKMHESDKSKLIDRMARIIGHEVRNPLTNIVLATEEMKQDLSDNEDAVLMLNMVHRNSERISTLIDNFLKNTRSSELNVKKVVLENVIKEAFNNCKDRILLKQIEHSFHGFNNKTELEIDPIKIEIVFTNIIINATEALEKTKNPKIKLSLKQIDNTVEVSVTDNGVGMSDIVKTNLFSPFYSNKQGGLGLGMANCKNILLEHKSEIQVHSEENKGSTFIIKFPIT